MAVSFYCGPREPLFSPGPSQIPFRSFFTESLNHQGLRTALLSLHLLSKWAWAAHDFKGIKAHSEFASLPLPTPRRFAQSRHIPCTVGRMVSPLSPSPCFSVGALLVMLTSALPGLAPGSRAFYSKNFPLLLFWNGPGFGRNTAVFTTPALCTGWLVGFVQAACWPVSPLLSVDCQPKNIPPLLAARYLLARSVPFQRTFPFRWCLP